jgi:hypothetical protein
MIPEANTSYMSRRLLTVEDTFLIQERGLVLAPGLVPVGNERFRVGDPILLKRPDGRRFPSRIGALEFIKYASPHPCDVVIMLRDLGKGDVPIGTEVWTVDPP